LSCGGIVVFVIGCLVTLLLSISMIGIPVAFHSFQILLFLAVPFGREIAPLQEGAAAESKCSKVIIEAAWLITGGAVLIPLAFISMVLTMCSIIFLPAVSKYPDIFCLLFFPVDKSIQFKRTQVANTTKDNQVKADAHLQEVKVASNNSSIESASLAKSKSSQSDDSGVAPSL
jgi:uncharacterized membrane protein YccF (DUF307 family)